ncbi:hypothetical protein DYADSP32_2987, partial [Dyadobacter sp. 32]
YEKTGSSSRRPRFLFSLCQTFPHFLWHRRQFMETTTFNNQI